MNNAPRVVPLQAPGLVGNVHHPTGAPLTAAERDWCRNRPPGVPRLPLPQPGDIVGFRAVHGGPVVLARVVEVDSITDPWAHEHDAHNPHGPDVNVWETVLDDARQPVHDPLRPGAYRFQLIADPWPDVVLCIEPLPGDKAPRRYTSTREARLPGSAGWTAPEEIGA